MRNFLIPIACCFCLCTHAQTTIVTGTITHAFNANAAGKADAGAKIYLLKYEADIVSLYTTINNFLTAKNLRNLNNDVSRLITLYKDSAGEIKSQKKYEAKYIGYQNTIAKIKTDEAERLTTLKNLDAETNQKFELLDKRTAKEISQAKLKASELKVNAGADGNFSIKDKPIGQYVILVISNNRTGFTTTEASGKVFVKILDVKEGEPINVTNKFIPD
jgi:hypothetical protein